MIKKEKGHYSEVVREVTRLTSTQPGGKMSARWVPQQCCCNCWLVSNHLLPRPSCPTPPAPPLRLQLLLAEVHQLSGDVSQALVVATETVRQCAEHNWKDLVVQGKLLIAQLQVSTLRCTGVPGFQLQLHSAISHMIAVLEQWSPMWYTPLEIMRDSTIPVLESRHDCSVQSGQETLKNLEMTLRPSGVCPLAAPLWECCPVLRTAHPRLSATPPGSR